MAFDIDKYTANSTAVGWGDLDFDEFDRNPLPASTLRTLRYMCDVEHGLLPARSAHHPVAQRAGDRRLHDDVEP
jgi:hypothetical protein